LLPKIPKYPLDVKKVEFSRAKEWDTDPQPEIVRVLL
jgi:hypothetical protein